MSGSNYFFGDFHRLEAVLVAYLEAKFYALKELIMAMGQATQTAINELNVEVSELAVTVAETVAKAEALRDQINDLTASNATLEEKNAELVRLSAQADALVADTLRPFSSRIDALDKELKDPATPLAPSA